MFIILWSLQDECEMLDKMMTPYWLRQKHYPNDPYKVSKNMVFSRRRIFTWIITSSFFFFKFSWAVLILQAYHVRHGITSPRVDDKGRFVRERPKVSIFVLFLHWIFLNVYTPSNFTNILFKFQVLLDDLTSEKYFYDR